MAKIAGRKNDGAWFRFNEWIVDQPAPIIAAFDEQLSQLDTLSAAFTEVIAYITATGAARSGFPASAPSWASELSVGIPRQLWIGVTTYDKYTNDGSGKYVKLMQHSIFALSKDIRMVAKLIRFSADEVQHLAGLTHPTPRISADRRQEGETKKAHAQRRLAEVTAWKLANPDEVAAMKKLSLTSKVDESKLGGLPESRPASKSSPRKAQPVAS